MEFAIESTLLQLKTWADNDDAHLYIEFLDENKSLVFDLSFKFNQFSLWLGPSCSNGYGLDGFTMMDVPTHFYRTWTIFKTATHLKIECNNMEVWSVEYRSVSDECHSSFTRDSSFIKFLLESEAPVIFYRSSALGKIHHTCTAKQLFIISKSLIIIHHLPTDVERVFINFTIKNKRTVGTLNTSTVTCPTPSYPNTIIEKLYPSIPGSTLEVKCTPGYVNSGSHTITCKLDTTWDFQIEPSCSQTGKIHHLTINVRNFNKTQINNHVSTQL